jgi:hypothetical protein
VVDHSLGAFAHGEKHAGQVDVDDQLEIAQRHLLGDLAGVAVRRDHHPVFLSNAWSTSLLIL